MKLSRRDLSALLPALAAARSSAQEPAGKANKMLTSKTFRYEDLPVKVNGQNKGRAVFDGETHLGFPVELHMTELAAGQMPHPPHSHAHEEVLMLRRGVLDAMYGGQTTHLTAGSVIYMASNVEHGWKNPGPEPAEYFVIALGKGKG
jgi:quercetin dioxygenase-like cupin family protein